MSIFTDKEVGNVFAPNTDAKQTNDFNDSDLENIFGADAINNSLVHQAIARTTNVGGGYGQNLKMVSSIDKSIDPKMSNPQHLADSVKRADQYNLKGLIDSNPPFRKILNNPYITLQTIDNAGVYGSMLQKIGLYDADRRLNNRRAASEIGQQIINNNYQITPEQEQKLQEIQFSNYFYRQAENTGFFRQGYEGAYENVFDIGRRWGKGALAYGGIKAIGGALSGPATAYGSPAAGAAVNVAADRIGKFAASTIAAQDIYNMSVNDAVADLAMVKDTDGNRLDANAMAWTARVIGLTESGLEFASDLVIMPGLGKFIVPDAFKKTAGKLGADGFKTALKAAIKDPAKKAALSLSAKKVAASIGTATAAEGITEFLQELSSIVLTNEALEASNTGKGTKFELTSSEEALKQAKDAGKAGAATGFFFGGAGTIYTGHQIYKTENLKQVEQTKVSEQFLNTVAEQSKSLDIQNPAEHGDVVQTIADDNGKGTMFVAAQSFKETYGDQAEDIAAKLGVSPEDLQKAADNNEEIVIKTGKAAEVFVGNPEGLQSLNKIKRFENDTLTPQQADAQITSFTPEATEKKRTYGKNWAEAQKGYEAMKKALMGANVAEENAEKYAKLFAQRTLSISEQFRISPEKWLKQNNIKVQSYPGAFGSEQVGSLSAEFEGGVGSVSTGDGDAGGVSYGKYQFNTKDGVVNNFVAWLKKQPNGRKYADALGDDVGSKNFNSAWERLAKEDPKGFGAMQDLYAKPIYYDTAASNLKTKYGFDIAGRSQALKEVLFSNSVQHGTYYGAQVFEEAAKLAKKPLAEMSDAEIIQNIYEVKLTDMSWSSGSPTLRPGLFNRWRNEREKALGMLNGVSYGQPITNNNINLDERIGVVNFDEMKDIFVKQGVTGEMINQSANEVISFIKQLTGIEDIFNTTINFNTKDINTVIGLPKAAYAQNHIIRNAGTMGNIDAKADNVTATRKTISNLREVLLNAVLVEVSPVKDTPKKRQGRAHKKKIDSYYSFFVPVKMNDNYYTLKITGENYKNNLSVNPRAISLYQVETQKNIEASHIGAKVNAGAADLQARNVEASSISIRDMLKNVKDREKQVYINPDGSGNFSQYEQSERANIEIYESKKDGELKRDTYINLFTKADLSSVLHEFGHLFLEDFTWLIHNADFVSEQAKKDWESLKKELDIKDGQIKKSANGFIKVDFTKEQHEKFARQFEQYLLEGKAPTIGLRNAFRSFKKWLTDIYRYALKDGNLEAISDEVRGVFDRLLATEDQIAAQRELLENFAIDSEADLSLWEEAYERAKETLFKEKMKEVRAEKLEAMKEELETLKQNIYTELEGEPVYQAISALEKGVVADFTENAKLNPGQLVKLYGEEILNGLSERILSETGILHPDDVADLYGFKSGEELLLAIKEAPPLNQKAQALFKEAKNNALSLTPQEQQQLAKEAINNEVTLDLLEREMERLSVTNDKKREAKELREQAKLEAEESIAGQSVRKAKGFRGYFNEAIKYAAESKQALAKNNQISALQSKIEQMKRQALGIESVRFKEEYQDALTYFDKFLKRTQKQKSSINSQELGVIQNLLQSLGLEKGKRTPELDVNIGVAEWVNLLPPAVREHIASDDSPVLVAASLQGQKLNNLTVQQFRDLIDAVKIIEHEGRTKDKLYNQDLKITVNEVSEKIGQSAEENVGENYSSKNYKPLPKKLTKLADKFNSWIIGTENIIWEVDGRKYDGVLRDAIWRPLVGKGFTMATNLTDEAQSRINGIWGAYSEAELWDMRQTVMYVPEIDDSLTKMEMITAVLNCGTEDNYRKLKDGRGWTDEQVEAIKAQLDGRDFSTVQAIWDMLESYYPMLNELEKKTKGIALKKVPAKSMQTAYGNLRGGYYPLKADTDNINTPSRQKESGKTNRPHTQQQHTKARTNATYAVSLDETFLYEHMEKVIHDIAYREVGLDSSRILYNKTTESALKRTIGADKYNEITTAIQKAISLQSEPMIAGETAIRWLRTRAVSSLMAGKLSVAAQQISGIFSSMATIGIGPVLNGIMGVAFNKSNVQFIRNNAAFMRERPKTRDRDIKDAYKRLTGELGGTPAWVGRLPKKGLDTMSEFGFKLIATMDMIVSYPTWYGGYLDGLRQFNGDHAKSVAYADTAVRQSQGSGLIIDQAAFQRDGNEYTKILSAFTTPGVALYRLMWRNIQKVKNNDIAYWRAAMNIMLAATAQGALAEVLAGRPPEEDEEWAKWAAKETLVFMASSTPILRDWVSYTFGESRTIMSSPISAPLESASKLAKTLAKAIEGERVDPNIAFRESLKLAGFGFAYPQQLNIFAYNFLAWGASGDDLSVSDILRFRKVRK